MLGNKGRKIAWIVSCAALLFLIGGTVLRPASALFNATPFGMRREFAKTFSVSPDNAAAQLAVDRKMEELYSLLKENSALQSQLANSKYSGSVFIKEKVGNVWRLLDRGEALNAELGGIMEERVRLTSEIDHLKKLAKHFGLKTHPDEYYLRERDRADF